MSLTENELLKELKGVISSAHQMRSHNGRNFVIVQDGHRTQSLSQMDEKTDIQFGDVESFTHYVNEHSEFSATKIFYSVDSHCVRAIFDYHTCEYHPAFSDSIGGNGEKGRMSHQASVTLKKDA